MAKTSFLNSAPLPQRDLAPPKAFRLLNWYDKHARDLPWRRHHGRAPSPYHTWISEIMLQQTGVSTVIPYYQHFTERWPNVAALADASEDEILGAWAGLGYYRRARMLHACAKAVHHEHDGIFPCELDALKALPGIGDYTANAIRTIAFDQPGNVVDGNVERVVSRLFTFDKPINEPKHKKELKLLAATLLPNKRHGDYAQALMDLGATICTPKNPQCTQCPWQKNCRAFASGNAAAFPVTARKKAIPHRYAAAFIAMDSKGRVLLQQRPAEGLLGGLWECPSTEWRDGKAWTGAAIARIADYKPMALKALRAETVHVFSHFKLTTALYHSAHPREVSKLFPKARWFAPDQLPPLSTLTRKVLTQAFKALGV